MAISRDDALRIALAHVDGDNGPPPSDVIGQGDQPARLSIREVLSVDEIGRPPLIYGLTVPLHECWIAYLDSATTAIRSSRVVLVSKQSGRVVYFGSANDEG